MLKTTVDPEEELSSEFCPLSPDPLPKEKKEKEMRKNSIKKKKEPCCEGSQMYILRDEEQNGRYAAEMNI